MIATEEVLAEVHALRSKLPDATGILVATVDGLLVAHDTQRGEPDVMAAMAAAQLGLSQQIARSTGQGDFLEAVTRCASGYLAVFAAGNTGLLTVLASGQLNVGRLYHEARPTAARLGDLLGPRAEPANSRDEPRAR